MTTNSDISRIDFRALEKINIAPIDNDLQLKPPVSVNIPGMDPIKLVAYYDKYISYYPNAEMETKMWFVQNVKPDWTILDVGANVGYYTIMFSRLVPRGKVFAFEPTSTIEMLNINLKYNHVLNNVETLRQALGCKAGKINDKIYKIWGNEPDEEVYDFNTIDNFVKERGIKVDAIKIDVDSFDFEVLRGAEETIKTQNPYIMVELNHALYKRRTEPAYALRWMAERGYIRTKIFGGENYLFKLTDQEAKLDAGYRFSPTITVEWA